MDVQVRASVYNVTPPEANQTTRTCDSRSNVKLTTSYSKAGPSGGVFITTSADYPTSCASAATCNMPTSTKDGRGFQTDYKYYPHGGIWRQTLPAGNEGIRSQKRYKYGQYYAYVRNANNNLVPVADPIWLVNMISERRTTAGLSDSVGESDERCPNTADEILTTYQYGGTNSINALSVRGEVVTADGVSLRTCYSYDDVGNGISVTTPRADLATCSDSAQWGAAAFTTGTRYDAMSQVVGVIYPTAGNGFEAVRNTYDEEGRILKIDHGSLTQWPGQTAPIGWSGFDIKEVTERSYDSRGLLLTEMRHSVTGEHPTLTQNTYDAVGQRVCTAVRMNPAAFASHVSSASGNLAACHTGSEGSYGPDRISTFDYLADGRLHLERRAVDTAVAQEYATYWYTPNGRISWVQDANGNRSQFQYDVFDRIYRLYFPQTTVGAQNYNPSDYEEYGYDENGNRKTLRLRSAETIEYKFDGLNRVFRKIVPGSNGWEVHYGYTLQGQNTYARFGSPTGLGVKNDYDGFGRLKSSQSIAATGSLPAMTYEYDKDGNRTQVKWPDGMYVEGTTPTAQSMAANAVGNVIGAGAGAVLSKTAQAAAIEAAGATAFSRPSVQAATVGGTVGVGHVTTELGAEAASQAAAVAAENKLTCGSYSKCE